jgi:hypothetical protein
MERKIVAYTFTNDIRDPKRVLLGLLWSQPLVKVIAAFWVLGFIAVAIGRLEFIVFVLLFLALPWQMQHFFGVVVRTVSVYSDGSFVLHLSDGREFGGDSSNWSVRLERNRTWKLYNAILRVQVEKKLVVSQLPDLGFPLAEIEKLVQIVATTKHKQ